jgi:aminoglycoside phosphotransferase (APT) family kinase protein
VSRLAGGTLQENWRIDVEFAGGLHAGAQSLVLRTTGASGIPGIATREQEFAVLRSVHRAGVSVPEPLWFCADSTTLGAEFIVMRFVDGVTSPYRLIREWRSGASKEATVERIGEELARLQTITPPNAELGFLQIPMPSAAHALIVAFHAYLDQLSEPHPAIEWIVRWLSLNAPSQQPVVLCHGDFRIGNFMVNKHGLAAVLDWELAHWGDPYSDLGWFCAKFWRLGAPLDAGGLASRECLYRGYERVSGRKIDPSLAHYWAVMANARWAIISLQQVQRHLSGREQSLELALIGRQTAEMELEALRLIEEGLQ